MNWKETDGSLKELVCPMALKKQTYMLHVSIGSNLVNRTDRKYRKMVASIILAWRSCHFLYFITTVQMHRNLFWRIVSASEKTTSGRKTVMKENRYKQAKCSTGMWKIIAPSMPIYSSPRYCTLWSTPSLPHRIKWECTTCKVWLCLNNDKNCFLDYQKQIM